MKVVRPTSVSKATTQLLLPLSLPQEWSWTGEKWLVSRQFEGCRDGNPIPSRGLAARKLVTAGGPLMTTECWTRPVQTQSEAGLSPCVGYVPLEPSVFLYSFCPIVRHAHNASSIYVLSTLIRKPRMILDFSLTLVFNHLVLTSYYSASIPTSLFFYAVVLVGCASTVIAAEQICVKREMREGLAVNIPQEDSEEAGLVEEMEMGSLGLPPRRD